MSNRNLYQKKHGLPGISMFSGKDGIDGTNGKNIYFGYITDFFDSIEIEVDNIVRAAKIKNQNGYYTGIFRHEGEAYIDQQSYTEGETYKDENVTILDNFGKQVRTPEQVKKSILYWDGKTKLGSKNQFRRIYTDEDFYEKYDYDDNYQALGYAKVDVSEKGKDASGLHNVLTTVWNSDLSNLRWKENFTGLAGGLAAPGKAQPLWNTSNATYTFSWPYTSYNPAKFSKIEWLDIAPGKVVAAKLPDGENRLNATSTLFTIEINGHSYAFVTGVSKHLGQTTYSIKDDGVSQTNPSIHDIIDEFENRNNRLVNFLKTSVDLIETVEITDKLKSDIKAGDILYFYTDKDYFDVYHTIEYMVVVTPALEGCTLEELKANASIVEPFNFKFIDSVYSAGSKFLVSQRKSTTVHYPEDVSKTGNNGRNFANLVADNGNALLNIGLMQKSGTTGSVVHFADNATSNANALDIVNMMSENEGYWNFKTGNVLKIKNLLLKNNNSGNLELEGAIMPSDIRFNSAGRIYTLTKDDFDFRSRVFNLKAEKFFTNVTLTKGKLGAIIITYNKQKVKTTGTKYYGDSAYCKTRKYEYGVSESAIIKLTEEYLTDTGHIVIVYVKMPNGMKYYSGHTMAVYNTALKNYEITVYEDLNKVADEEEALPSQDERVVFICSGLSADQTTTPGSLDVYLPESIGDENANNVVFYMNSQQFVNSVSSSWCTISNKVGPVKEPEGSPYEGMYHYSFQITANSNIPSSTTVVSKNVRDYISQPGTSSSVSGCEVFNAILKNGSVNSSERSVTVSVLYKDELYNNRTLKSIYKLTQSGYVEKRKVPVVNLSARSSLVDLESSNDIEKGVLSNQFQFFVDIDVEDFNADVWGSYVEEDKVTLNFTIASSPVDYEFVSKYGAQSTLSTFTFHAIPEIGEDLNNNFLSIKVEPLNPNTYSPIDMTQKEISDAVVGNDSDFKDKIRIKNTLSSSGGGVKYTGYDSAWKLDNNVMFDSPLIRPSGINCETEIEFKNLTFSDCENGKFRFRVIVEMSNPIFSRLYFRYYVKNLYVNYNGNIFYLGTDNLSPERTVGKVSVYDYMYATKTINAFICPMSLTAVPPCSEKNNFKRSDDYMRGSSEQLSVQLSPYIPQGMRYFYRSNSSVEEMIQNMINSQEIPWFEFSLKTRYLQDNVENIAVKPIHILDYIDKISEDVPAIKEIADKFKTAFRTEKSYATVFYNANLFKQKMRDDRLWFNYNLVDFATQRYGQVKNNIPSFLEQSVTYQVRTPKLINAMKYWNKLYQDKGLNTESLVSGDNSAFGNAYIYLPAAYETGECSLSLEETKSLNELDFFVSGEAAKCDMFQPVKSNDYQPYPEQWFRSLLYQFKWLYPYHYINDEHKEKIDGYKLSDVYTFIQNSNKEKLIPYNLAYTIYPRCAYDDEHDNIIVFMLRKPSVVRENQYEVKRDDVSYLLFSDTMKEISDIGYDVP